MKIRYREFLNQEKECRKILVSLTTKVSVHPKTLKESKKSQSGRRYLQRIHFNGRDPLQCKLKKTSNFVEK